MLSVTAKLRVNEGKAEEFIAAAAKMIAAVKEKEAGSTLSYELFRSTTDPNLFLFLESYTDEEALRAHSQTPHMAEFGATLRGLLAGRAEISRFQPLS
jgi:quinol monooxygenase YgiN